MKKILILTASPRRNGNTNTLVKEVIAQFDQMHEAADPAVSYEVVDLYERNIAPCRACRHCQTDWSRVYCAQRDDFDDIAPKIEACDMLVLASPIYSWYCTPPMKALLDRCVYAFNKYYDDAAETHGGERGPSLWKGKEVALITTCGYEPAKGADLLEEGIRRYCKHSGLAYTRSLIERHPTYKRPFMDEEKAARAKAFAIEIAGVEQKNVDNGCNDKYI